MLSNKGNMNTYKRLIKEAEGLKKLCLNKETTSAVLTEALSELDDLGDIDMALLKLVKFYIFDMELLQCLKTKIDSFSTPVEIIKKSFTIKGVNNFGVIANMILSLFNYELTTIDIEWLMSEADRMNEDFKINIEDAVFYLENKNGQLEYAPVPEWVNIKEGENLSLLNDVITSKPGDISKDQFLEIINQGQDIFYELDQNKNLQSKEISITLQEALETVLSAYSDDKSDEEKNAVRVFGPINRFTDSSCMTRPGPCRMLECICLEERNGFVENDIVDYKTNNWFTGNCDTCVRKIRNMSHAVRFPEEDGGWKGCYCSAECMKKNIVQEEKTNLRINIMFQTLSNFGIMDRTKV